ncbi:molybdopterin-dependent oxidoreductase [Kordiimonas aquimaris]|uniref:molybdopterin-dependent oxidoreductase n=1 Tax=Kordiimonas aquimaris TaxID=707591 RepID=UPI0021D2BBF9|nr:molybdopterin-dependent oxidoreductase [Kordiimonas aquimaris]
MMAEQDQMKTTTCYMCACRCGIRVHTRDGKLRYIEGNPDHPVNKGVLCAKGSAGIMQQNSPAKLTNPLLRVGERGSGEFKEISWDEAFDILIPRLKNIRDTDPKKLAFFTGRDQSQALTGWWAAQFGTPNYAAHGGFCSVNMAAAGLYSIGGSFWEFGEPDWDHTKYLLMFGVAEDHDSNPIKIGIGKLKSRNNTKFVSVNPVRTGYSAVADEWVGVRPGTDALFVGALIQELLRIDAIDWKYLARYTNATWLVRDAKGAANDSMFMRDKEGNPLAVKVDGSVTSALGTETDFQFAGETVLPNGKQGRPAFEHIAEEFFHERYTPENAAAKTGIPAETIKRIAHEIADVAFQQEITLDIPWTDWRGVKHEKMTGRPVAMHAMRGISAHSNGFDTCRMIHILQMLIGSIDVPGGFRYKPPYPKAVPPPNKPASAVTIAGTPLNTVPLGFPTSPIDLNVDAAGNPMRLDKAFSWDHPLSVHGMMHMAMHNAWAGDPYKIDTLFMYMANMAWNSSMNVKSAIKYLTDTDAETGEYVIPFVVYSDAFYSETVPYADLILPDTTYLERWDCISILDRPIGEADAAADSIRQPVISPDRNVRPFQDVLLDIGARLELPGLINEDKSPKYPKGYADYIVNHERAPGIGSLAGWRGKGGSEHGKGAPNTEQLDRYVENGCFWHYPLPKDAVYYKHANASYLAFAVKMGWLVKNEPVVLNIYSEIMQSFRNAARGHGGRIPPEHLRSRVEEHFSPVPTWHAPIEHTVDNANEFPFSAITQRPMHMYHSWGSQNAWLRQITNKNALYMNRETGTQAGLSDGDWIWVTSTHGKARVELRLMDGCNPGTVWTWNAIGKRKGAWGLDEKAPEFNKGFLMNHVISEVLNVKGGGKQSNSDPVTGQAAWFDVRVKLETQDGEYINITEPLLDAPNNDILGQPSKDLTYGFDRHQSFKKLDASWTGETVNYTSWQTRNADDSQEEETV